MSISKKPRSKTAPKTSAAAVLPDRRAMESFLTAIAGRRGDDATAKAQDVMYEAWERTTPRSRIALARKALGISPLCADAYVLLAEEAAQSLEEARDYYAKGVVVSENLKRKWVGIDITYQSIPLSCAALKRSTAKQADQRDFVL
jgi:hypothetical protein